MTKETFNTKLKDLDLSLKDFSILSGVPYKTILNWGATRKGEPTLIPVWVDPFLTIYIKAKKFDYIKDSVCQRVDK
jgi:hypothetical protein